MRPSILIADIGTTLCKSLLFEENGRAVASSSHGYITKRQRPLWAEQDPDLWWKSFKLTSKTVLKKSKRIEIIGILGMGHGPVILDSKDRPIIPCIIWPDLRAQPQARELRAKVRELGIERSISGTIQAWYTAAKLLWIQQNYPDKFKMIRKVMLPKDYIRYKLGGGFVTDSMDAAGTQLYDLRLRKWNDHLLEYLQLNSEQFPDVHSMEEIAGETTTSAAKETGLRVGTPILTGSGDWGTTPIALGNTGVGDGFIYSGTAPCFGISIDREIDNDTLSGSGLFCDPYYQLPGRWMLWGSLSSAGAALNWYTEQFESVSVNTPQRNKSSFKKLEKDASKIEPGSEGLIFLPHVMGERCPENPDARAVLYGLSLGHTRSHIARAIHEGIAFELRKAISFVEETSQMEFKEITAFGGGMRSKLMAHIISNVLRKRLLLPREQEIGALGLALVASAVLQGSPLSYLYARKLEIASRVEPQMELARRYDKVYKVFRRVEDGVAAVYHEAANLEETTTES